jgi:tRNA1Val (adenine37-N6)-methyltransferase
MSKYRIDDLQIAGLYLKQDAELFCFGIDAVLLANYAAKFIKPHHRVLDLGCGNGIIPVLLTAKSKSNQIYGLEINKSSVNLAKENIEFNDLQAKVKIIEGNIKSVPRELKEFQFEIVLSNPPYIQNKDGAVNKNRNIASAKHELDCTLEDVIRCAAQLLKNGGAFVMIHRTQRLTEILNMMHHYHIEPKELIMIYPNTQKKSNLFLIKGIKGANSWMDILPPIYVYDQNGNYTQQIEEIYEFKA